MLILILFSCICQAVILMSIVSSNLFKNKRMLRYFRCHKVLMFSFCHHTHIMKNPEIEFLSCMKKAAKNDTNISAIISFRKEGHKKIAASIDWRLKTSQKQTANLHRSKLSCGGDNEKQNAHHTYLCFNCVCVKWFGKRNGRALEGGKPTQYAFKSIWFTFFVCVPYCCCWRGIQIPLFALRVFRHAVWTRH